MKLLLFTSCLCAVAVIATGCGKTADDSVPVAAGPNASVVAQVDCGDDGVANVTVTYGSTKKDTLVGRNSTTRSAGGVPTYSNQFGISPEFGDTTLTMLTQPTRGTCTSTLTDYNTGDVVAERETAGKAELSVVVQAD